MLSGGYYYPFRAGFGKFSGCFCANTFWTACACDDNDFAAKFLGHD
jgi:hypothetical protein